MTHSPVLDPVPSADDLHVDVLPAGEHRARIVVTGAFDFCGVASVQDVVGDQLQQGRRAIRLDLAGVTFIDCAGVRALVDMHNSALAARATITVAATSPCVHRLLMLTRLYEALHVLPPEHLPDEDSRS